jgi:hypothetical protein
MKTLTSKQVDALLAFLDCFDMYTTGAWSQIEEHMREDFGIDDPEEAMEEIAEELRK